MTTPQVAVLTGDLIGSTGHPVADVDTAMQAIRLASANTGRWHTLPHDTRFTRFRGDGWQIVLAEPWLSLRAAVVIQGSLMALGMESRISIGIADAETLGTTDLSDAAGAAFELSGHGLDQMGDSWRFAIKRKVKCVEDQLIADLLGERLDRWTAAQAEAASLYLASPSKLRTLFDIGKELGISPQAVNDRLRGAGCQVIASVLRRWEALRNQTIGDQEGRNRIDD
jgi:hypothetical protein